MSKKAVKKVKKKFKKQIVDTHNDFGDDTVILEPEALHDAIAFLRDEPDLDFNMLVDITALDYHPREPRFEMVYHLLSLTHLKRIRIKVQLPGDKPTVDSIHDLYGCANWAERETYDMYGIQFTNHPDLRRILLYEEFEGYPLRKDYDQMASQPRINLLAEERPTTNMYNPNFGEYGPEKENR